MPTTQGDCEGSLKSLTSSQVLFLYGSPNLVKASPTHTCGKPLESTRSRIRTLQNQHKAARLHRGPGRHNCFNPREIHFVWTLTQSLSITSTNFSNSRTAHTYTTCGLLPFAPQSVQKRELLQETTCCPGGRKTKGRSAPLWM